MALCILATVVDTYFNRPFFYDQLILLRNTLNGNITFLSWNTALRDHSALCTLIGNHIIKGLNISVEDIDNIIETLSIEQKKSSPFPHQSIEEVLQQYIN